MSLEPAIAKSVFDGEWRIVITGASGWLGLATLELLEQALGSTFEQRVFCFGSTTRNLQLRSGRRVQQQSLDAMTKLPNQATWVLHFAFLTKDRAENMSEAAYLAANDAISETVIGALDRIGARAIFVASSGAAKHAYDPVVSPAMRLYGAMKLQDENRFADWARTSGCYAVIGRIFNITGPYMNKHQAYAFASFILDGLASRPISVRAPHRVIRSYVAIRELMSLVFALLAKKNGNVVRFDSGGDPLELGEVAVAVAAEFPGGRAERSAIIEPDENIYHGDGPGYDRLLATHGIAKVPLPLQARESIAYMRGIQAQVQL